MNSRHLTPVRSVRAATIVLQLTILLGAPTARSIEVSSPSDSGTGTLRAAIEVINSQATTDNLITFAPSLGTIMLQTELEITADVVIQGPGARAQILWNPQSSAPPFHGFFTIHRVRVSISGLTFWGGAAGLTQPTDLVPNGPGQFPPRLGLFGDHGGGADTLALLAGSAALDQGHRSGTDVDQRGFARDLDDPGVVNAPDGDGSDIGAYESCAFGPSLIVLHQTGRTSAQGLREAIDCLAPGGTIRFTSESVGLLRVSGGELIITKNLSLVGSGANRLAIGEAASSRVFNVHNGEVNISGLTIRGGDLRGFAPGESALGGGIYNLASLTLADCRITLNSARGAAGRAGNSTTLTGGPGGEALGGGIYNGGVLTLLRCTLDGNEAAGGPGGLPGANGPVGGSGGNGGHAMGGAVCNDQVLTVLNCTIDGNGATGGTGAPGATGGSFSGRGGDGGNALGGALAMRGDGMLLNVTLTGGLARGGFHNTGSPAGTPGGAGGGGIYVSPSSFTECGNTIFAGNAVDAAGIAIATDAFGFLVSGGRNLVGVADANSAGWMAGSDFLGIAGDPLDPRLGPLRDNGGPTPTRLPGPTSPVFDAGDDAVLSLPYDFSTDHRHGRRKCAAAVDIGAVEIGSLVRITGIRKTAGGWEISFTTEAGWNHRLASAESLPDQPGPWPDTVTVVSGTGGIMTVTDDRPPSPVHRFYHVEVTQ